MEIIRAKHMGFCFGVEEAINICEKFQNRKEKKYILGMLVHNKFVVDEMKKKGFETVLEDDLLENKDNLKKGDIVIIRAHGTSKNVLKKLFDREVEIIDATCPFVDNIKKAIKKANDEKYKILFVGDKNHPEVKGIISYADDIQIFETIDDTKQLIIDENEKYFLSSQTTFNKNKFKDIKDYFLKYDNVKILDKICGATAIRQKAVEDLAKKVDLMLVVGDNKSSNTKKLYDISKNLNKNTYMIESVEDLDLNIFQNIQKIGITAGASTPEIIINKIENHIRGIFNA